MPPRLLLPLYPLAARRSTHQVRGPAGNPGRTLFTTQRTQKEARKTGQKEERQRVLSSTLTTATS